MALTKLGLCIERLDSRNSENKYGEDSVVGISTQKKLIKTKADLQGVNLASYKLMLPGSFVYVPDTSRRGDKISLAFNSSEKTYLVSSIYEVFIVKENCGLLADYLFLYFNRPEFDRFSRFNSWGFARETFSFDDLCDIELELPAIEVQQKYVDIYNAMLENQKNYERGLEDLKLVCDGYIEDLRRNYPCEAIGKYLKLSDTRNSHGLPLENVRGISTSKTFIETKADMKGIELDNYKMVAPNYFSYVPDTSRRGDKISLALNTSNEIYLVSSISIVFSTQDDSLLSKYLMLFLSRTEFDRYARFNSWGSARETFDWDEMCNMRITIPNIKIQKAIAEIFEVYNERKEINEKLKAQIKDICPILIRGSLEENGYEE